MFKDYYKILGVSTDASVEIIRKAYRNLSLKWHPDRNPDTDVTSIMQDINEAYAILKDEEKRSLYDEEYRSFMKDLGVCIKDECNRSYEPDYDYNTYEEERDWDFDYTYDYDVKDEKLKDEILKARQYAKDIVDDFIKNFGVLTKTASKGAADSILKYALAWIVAGILLFILGNIFTCS